MSIAPAEKPDIAVNAGAWLPMRHLTPVERQRLDALLASPDVERSPETRRTVAGHFVTPLSAGKRVLWANENGRRIVLSIADDSYRARA